jgi:UPF0176 protein
MDYLILAYYHFVAVDSPQEEVAAHKAFFEGRDVKGRIYISKEGINGQMSARKGDGEAYIDWLRGDTRFEGVDFKVQGYPEHVFPRMTVKERRQLVALDAEVDLSARGEYLSPDEWQEMLAQGDAERLLLDVRNDYEWEIGHFEGAELPLLEQFRAFPNFAKQLKSERDPKKTKVMMYCTGGIRCEVYSALLKKEGFEQVFQLRGGVINYGLEKGSEHWKGKLFVFDDRLAVPISEDQEPEVISHCLHCEAPSDLYYNCANMSCNELFLSCPSCAERLQGCCSQSCSEAPGLRPFQQGERPKPFRRLHLLNHELSS